jgi:hypothetical protein
MRELFMYSKVEICVPNILIDKIRAVKIEILLMWVEIGKKLFPAIR